MKLFEIFGLISLEGDDADKQLKKTDGLGAKLGKTLGGIGKLAAGGLAVGTTAMIGMATKSAEATDRIDKMSQSIGISRKSFQQWDFITSQSGTSMQVLQKGAKTLTNRLDELKEGTGEGASAFEELGISLEDVKDKTQEEVLEMTIKALQQMPASSKKAALSMKLLGGASQSMTPLLNTSAEATEKMKEQAEDLGLVLSDEAVDAGVQFTDAMDQTKRMLGSVGSEIGVKVMPIFMKLLSWVTDNMPTIEKITSKVFDGISFAIDLVVDIIETFLVPAFAKIKEWIDDNKEELKDSFDTTFSAVKDVIQAAIDVVGALWDIFVAMWDDLQPILDALGPALKATFEGALALIVSATEAIRDFIVAWTEAEGLGEKLKVQDPVGGAAKKFASKLFNLDLNQQQMFFGGNRAAGGAVTKGATYRVNELGEELFTPHSNGYITPNGAIGMNAGGININLNGATFINEQGVEDLTNLITDYLEGKGVNQ